MTTPIHPVRGQVQWLRFPESPVGSAAHLCRWTLVLYETGPRLLAMSACRRHRTTAIALRRRPDQICPECLVRISELRAELGRELPPPAAVRDRWLPIDDTKGTSDVA